MIGVAGLRGRMLGGTGNTGVGIAGLGVVALGREVLGRMGVLGWLETGGAEVPGGRVKGGLGVGTGDTGVRLERRMLRGARIWRRMLETADAGMHIAGAGGAGPGGGAEAGRTGGVWTGEADVKGNGGCGSQRMVGVLVAEVGSTGEEQGVLLWSLCKPANSGCTVVGESGFTGNAEAEGIGKGLWAGPGR